MLRETANVFQMESEVHQLNPSWCFVDSIGLIAPVRSTLAVPEAPASSTQQARPSKLDPASSTQQARPSHAHVWYARRGLGGRF